MCVRAVSFIDEYAGIALWRRTLAVPKSHFLLKNKRQERLYCMHLLGIDRTVELLSWHFVSALVEITAVAVYDGDPYVCGVVDVQQGHHSLVVGCFKRFLPTECGSSVSRHG